jgi:predicted CXXCH cytochrome family protein
MLDVGCFLLSLLVLLAAVTTRADTVLNSKHNLSVTSPGTIKASSETEICIFCHTPHRATGEQPLWNHAASTATYTPYSSSTLKATVGQPTGASKLCLSCHDGTVALGLVNSRATPIQLQGGVTTMPSGPANLGTDLSQTHPVSFVYDAALATAAGNLKDPATLTDKVRLDHSGQLQCTACHDPHNDEFGKFLVMDNTGSALCLACHIDSGWPGSGHGLSRATLTGTAAILAERTHAKTVAANACGNCHTPHSAGAKERLLIQAREEETCFTCHNGSVVANNLAAEFNKISTHPVLQSSSLHNSIEDPINAPRHAACSDCHNSHASNAKKAVAPNVPGAIAGVVGVNTAGTPVKSVTREYELCFRCHADSVARGRTLVNRQSPETNTRLEFSPGNQSFHPVMTPGKNPNVPSLIAPWTSSSLMYCTDCHNNDQGPRAGGKGPNGPHGSAYPPLLERQLVLTDFGTETSANYALCYKCHSRESILADQSFKYHRKHVVDDKTACTTCHDSHGADNARLINFNRNYASPSANGRLEFIANGAFRGTCSVKCHGRDHDAVSYSPESGAEMIQKRR